MASTEEIHKAQDALIETLGDHLGVCGFIAGCLAGVLGKEFAHHSFGVSGLFVRTHIMYYLFILKPKAL